MLKLNNLSKNFGKKIAIDYFNLEIKNPGLYIFVGTNGSGKSTLFNIIFGLIPPNIGEVICAGENIRLKPHNISFSTEPFITEPSLSIEDLCNIRASIKNAPKEEINEWLKFWDLSEVKAQPLNSLSTGMVKRLSIVLSLIGAQKLLLWDEPFNGLDPVGINKLNILLEKLISDNKYILLSTHLLNEINTSNATYFVFRNGKLIGSIPPNISNTKDLILQLLNNP